MRHDVFFDEISAYDTWGLILASPPVIAPPEVKTKLLESPGMDGAIDLTTAIRGYPVFEERTGTLTFVSRDRFARWNAQRSRAMGMLQGHRVVLRFQDDPGWYWEGTCRVRGGDERPRGATVTIEYRMYPYKFADELSTAAWKWDPFSFVDGVVGNGLFDGVGIEDGVVLQYNEQATGEMPVLPRFLTDVPAIVTVLCGSQTVTVTLTAWTPQTIPGLVLYRGQWLYNGRAATVTVTKTGDTPVTFAITQQPSNVTGSAGSRVKCHVEAVSEDEITYQWQYKSTTGNWTTPTTNTFVGHQTATVTIPVTEARNGYQFRCQVTSGGTTITSNAITLTTASPMFAILNQPINNYAEPGDSVSFVCIAQGDSPSYQWQKRRGSDAFADISGAASSTLSVDVTDELNGTEYRCVVTDGEEVINSVPAVLRVIRNSVNVVFTRGKL